MAENGGVEFDPEEIIKESTAEESLKTIVENGLEEGFPPIVESIGTKRSCAADIVENKNGRQPKRTKLETITRELDFSSNSANPEDAKVLNDLQNLLQETSNAKCAPQEALIGDNDPRTTIGVEKDLRKTDNPANNEAIRDDTRKTGNELSDNEDSVSPKMNNVDSGRSPNRENQLQKSDNVDDEFQKTRNDDKDASETFEVVIKREIDEDIYLVRAHSPENPRTEDNSNRVEVVKREPDETLVDSDSGFGGLPSNDNVSKANASNDDSNDCPNCRKAAAEKASPKLVFECTNCEKEFPTRRKYKIHGESRECDGCGEWFPSACMIRMHQCEHSGCWRGKFGCTQCGAVFEEQSFLARHRLKHTVTDCKKGKRLKCKYCDLRHYSEKYLLLHTYHHPRMGCPVCRTRFSDLGLFTKHCGNDGTQCAQSRETQNAKNKKKSRKTKFQSPAIESRSTVTIPKKPQCEPDVRIIEVVETAEPAAKPAASVASNATLIPSTSSSTIEKRTYSCAVCEKVFFRAAKYYAHAKTRFCQGCNVAFVAACLIRLHQFEHPQCCEGRFPCDKCGAVFKNQEKLDQHAEKHETAKSEVSQKRFKCGYCQFQHCSKIFLETHIRHHPKFGCPACGLQFENLKEFRDHCGGPVYLCQTRTEGLVDGLVTLDDDDDDVTVLDKNESATVGDVLDLDMNVECDDEHVLPTIGIYPGGTSSVEEIITKKESVEAPTEVGHYNRPGPEAGAKEAELKKSGKQDTYSCFDCGARAASFREWKQHRAVKHGDVQMYKCDQCPYSSTYKYEVERHKRCRHPKKK